MRQCIICKKEILGTAWLFTEGLAHPGCALDAQAETAEERILGAFGAVESVEVER